MATTTWNTHLNLLTNELQNALVQSLSSSPTGIAGRIYYNSTTGALMWYDGLANQWISAASGEMYGDEAAIAAVAGALIEGNLIEIEYDSDDDTITIAVGEINSTDIADFDTAVEAKSLSDFAVPTGDVPFNSQKITGLADGSSANDAATFGQITAITSGQKWKEPVRAATTANITLSGAQTIDGVSVVAGNRVLVKNQSTTSGNGIYVAASGAWTRATDADAAAELNSATVLILEGTVGQGDIYTQTATITTVGSDSQTWSKTGEGNTVYTSDGTTIELVGNSFRIASGAAGDGLTGGGGSALAVNTGTGLEISSDAVRIATSAAGDGLTGGGASALAVNPGTGLEISSDTVRIAAAAAGNGLTGGAGSALAVGAGTGITVGATTVGITNAGVTETQLNTSVAGAGLAGGGGTALSVNVDDSSIEINTDTLRVKAAGISDAMLATAPLKRYSTTWTSGTSKTVTHNLGRTVIAVTVYDEDDARLEGVLCTLTDDDELVLEVNTGPSAVTWTVVVVA